MPNCTCATDGVASNIVEPKTEAAARERILFITGTPVGHLQSNSCVKGEFRFASLQSFIGRFLAQSICLQSLCLSAFIRGGMILYRGRTRGRPQTREERTSFFSAARKPQPAASIVVAANKQAVGKVTNRHVPQQADDQKAKGSSEIAEALRHTGQHRGGFGIRRAKRDEQQGKTKKPALTKPKHETPDRCRSDGPIE